STYGQSGTGRLQVLLGLDGPVSDPALLASPIGEAPSHVSVGVVDPGRTGTPLRTMLAYLAHAPLVAFLDSGNLWRADHLSRLAIAVAGLTWALLRRAFVHGRSGTVLVVDDWEAVGPPDGSVAVDCVMLAVAACEPVFRLLNAVDGGTASGRALAAI